MWAIMMVQLIQMLAKAPLILTIFRRCLENSRAVWSITSRREGQHLKLIFSVFIKLGNSF